MRKIYVKPVLEGEAFTANEYVAACWTATCIGCDATEEGYDALAARIKGGTEIKEDNYIYSGDIDGKPACSSSTETSAPSWVDTFWDKLLWEIIKAWFGGKDDTTITEYHPVALTSGWDNHPNASV